MDGGALIGQGTYGCIFDPPLQCENDKKYQHKRGEIGKVTEALDASVEIKMATFLSKIPNSSKYFIIPNLESVCTPKPLKSQHDKNGLAECKAIKQYDLETMYHFTMPYGGLSVYKLIDIKSKSFNPFKILNIVKHLLEATTLLTLNGAVHFDLHPGNVLLNSKGEAPRIIDFGMGFLTDTINKETLNDRWKKFNPERSWEAPEVLCATGVHKGYPLQDVVLDIIKKNVPLRQAEALIGLSLNNQMRSFVNFWKSSKSTTESKWIDLFKLYWTGFDSWGIGVIILQLYRFQVMMQGDEDTEKGHMRQIKGVLRGLLLMDPRKRLDSLEALMMLDPDNSLLTSDAGKAWIQERTRVRALL